MHPVELIFINWNSADLLFAAAATLDQTKMPYRICVVDNGSADDSCAQIRARLPRIAPPRRLVAGGGGA